MTATTLAGWTPVRLCAVQQRFCVDWARLGPNRFTDSFFDQTISRALQDPARLLFRRLTAFEGLDADTRALEHARPAGFIFHLSRSGSTLVAQMLASLSQNIVISEASPIDQLLAASWIDEQAGPDLRVQCLRGLIRGLAQPRGGGERYTFVKFHAWHALALPLIHAAFPEVPWIFLYRDPVEVLVSQERIRGTELIPGLLDPRLVGLDPGRLPAMPVATYGACVLARVAQAALDHATLGRSRFVNFAELPGAVGCSLGEFFETEWGDADRQRMAEVTQRHSKRPDSAHAADSESKQQAASDEIRALAREWFGDIYPRLEARRSG